MLVVWFLLGAALSAATSGQQEDCATCFRVNNGLKEELLVDCYHWPDSASVVEIAAHAFQLWDRLNMSGIWQHCDVQRGERMVIIPVAFDDLDLSAVDDINITRRGFFRNGVFLESWSNATNVHEAPAETALPVTAGSVETKSSTGDKNASQTDLAQKQNQTDEKVPLPAEASIGKPLPVDASVGKPLPVDAYVGKPLPVYASVSKPLPVDASVDKPLPVNTAVKQPLPLTTGSSDTFKATGVGVEKNSAKIYGAIGFVSGAKAEAYMRPLFGAFPGAGANFFVKDSVFFVNFFDKNLALQGGPKQKTAEDAIVPDSKKKPIASVSLRDGASMW